MKMGPPADFLPPYPEDEKSGNLFPLSVEMIRELIGRDALNRFSLRTNEIGSRTYFYPEEIRVERIFEIQIPVDADIREVRIETRFTR